MSDPEAVPRRRRWRLSIVVVAATALVLAAVGVWAVAADRSRPCTGRPVTVTVAASAGQFTALDRLARDWRATKPTVGGRCAAAAVVLVPAHRVADALPAAWAGGPRPDVWIPESSLWLALAAARPEARAVLPGAPVSIASSPVVMAVRRPVAETLGWPGRQLTWADVLAGLPAPGAGRPLFGLPEPTRSAEGIAGVLAVLDRDGDGTLSTGELAAAPAFTRRLGTVAPSASAFFDERPAAPGETATPAVAAFPAIERDVADYDAAQPPVPVVPVYADRAGIVADYPYAVFNASWVDRLRRTVADRFLRYLLAPAAQRVFGSDGFRAPGGDASRAPRLAADRGFRPAVPPHTAPSADAVNQVMSQWVALRRPVNLLVAVDTSGSMNDPVPGAGLSRLELMRRTVLAGLDSLTDRTSVGLWQFAKAPDYRELVSFGPVTGMVGETPRSQALADAVRGLTAGGGTALYSTVRAAVGEMRQRWRPDATNAVLIVTDGIAADDTGPTRAQLLDLLRREAQPDRPVTVVALAVGPADAADALREVCAAAGGGALLVRDPDTAVRDLIRAFAGRP